ncbi:MAG TPA: VOC family protein [Candidatus Acidoferrales bacterium]|nr:VOC family protein [Candidatus Acidoferrales bacterium]
MANVRPIPEGYHTITPSLTCRNASKAIEFYKNAFGAKELHRLEGPNGTIGHAELQIGDSRLMVNDEIPGMSKAPNGGGTGEYLVLYVEDCDRVFNSAQAAGAKVEMPLSNQFWGDRYGKLADPFGHHWGIATHVENVSPQDMERRSKEYMAKAAGQHS